MEGTYFRKSEFDQRDPHAEEDGALSPSVSIVIPPKPVTGGLGIDSDTTLAQEGDGKSKGKAKKKKPEKPPVVSLRQLFRYATRLDVLLMIFGTVGAVIHGATLPVQFIIFGELIDRFVEFTKGRTTSTNGTVSLDLEGQLSTYAIYFVYLALATLLIGYVQIGFWSWTGVRQTRKMRLEYFKSVLKQDIGWFDTVDSGELNHRLAEDLQQVSEGIGRKIALFLQSVSMFLSGLVMGFAFGWKLTLVILASSPLMVIAGIMVGKIFSAFSARELKAYAKAGSIAEEVISSIRTVAAFGGEKKEIERYSSHLCEARDIGVRKSLTAGLGFGFFQLSTFASFALAFWYGSKLITDGEMTAGNLLIVFFSIMLGAQQLGQAGPHFEAIGTAQGAAYQVFNIIDRVPPFDSCSTEGEKPEAMKGDIEFRNIHFSYPSRPDVKILNGLNLNINSGQTVALVGESGCGKSTVVKFLQRFYDPNQGEVTIDGRSIPSLNVKWLRQRIGIVSQEPVLFATTIAENIRYGKDGATQREIEDACKMANAHYFISCLPEKYETLVGERGAQLSGGQKQRIAIARALVKDPKILLLDEATSALDTESESAVQAALDVARRGRTTIIIAHRLSTVRNADVIAAIEDGVVVEKGTHAELMETEGVYQQLVTMQTYEETKHPEDHDDDDEEDNEFDKFDGGLDKDIKDLLEFRKFRKAMRFMRRISSLSTDDDGEVSGLQRKISKRLSRRLSMAPAKDEKKKKTKGKVEEEDVEPAPVKRILKMNKTEWPFLVAGSFGAILNGLFPMVFALVLGEMVQTFSLTDVDEMKKESLFWSLMFLALGGGSCFGQIMQYYMFGKSGEILTLRLRKLAFESILKQEMSFFDDPLHSTGALTTALATHASDVKGATGSRLGSIVTSLTAIIACLVFAFYSGWMLTLVVIAFLPFMILAGVMQIKSYTAGGQKADNLLKAGAISVEAIENIRNVVSLGIELKFYEKYVKTLVVPHKLSIRRAHLFGLTSGLAEAIVFCCSAAACRFSGYLVVKGDMDLGAAIKVIFSIVIGARILGQVNALSPGYVKAKIAAARLFKLVDRVSAIDSSSDDGLTPSSVEGSIQFSNVRFRYPTRPKLKVLRGLTLTVPPGWKVALVGSSGCGKSTLMSLLERFYDVMEGEVSVDGNSVPSLNIKWLRSRMGIVSQEPVLFACSIAENIAYGDNSRAVSMEEIETAAKAANIHSFINTLPKGYDTLVGDKGTLISGGQKQRIAIARALIRNPRILLLDEATSALDTDSEKVVQEALDAASKGRTTIVIAHRLSTIQNADLIVVVDHGRVVEQGPHHELLALQGTYYSLVTAQIEAGENGDE